MRGGNGRKARPGFVSRAGEAAVEKKQELTRAAVYGGWLPKGQPHPNGPVQRHARRRDVLVQQQIDETAACGVRPDVLAQQMP